MAFSNYHEIISWELRAAFWRYNDTWEEVLWKPERERERFLTTVEQHRLPVVILSCLLLECAINFYFATKCDAARFAKLERKSLREKWDEAPREFAPTYNLTTGADLENDLEQLINRRNAIVHPKPLLSIDGDNRHKGNEPAIVLDEHDFIGRCTSLPFRLVDNLLSADRQTWVEMSNVRLHCSTAASQVQAARQRSEVWAKTPRELVEEIMLQGYDRKMAQKYAILLGDKPQTDEAGNFIIRHGKTITLKPLKFFSAKGRPAGHR